MATPSLQTLGVPALPGLPRARLERLLAVEAGHFWHAPRRRLLVATIRRALAPAAGVFLDVGCGTGALVDALVARGYDARGVDPWAAAIGLASPRFATAGVEALPYADASVAGAGAFDLLEHLDDDRAAVAELVRVLAPGGALVASVPAWPALWSRRDVLACHRRRYRRGELVTLLEGAGLAVERLFGYQALLLPLLFVARALERPSSRDAAGDTTAEDRPPAPINALLRAVNEVEVAAGDVARPPLGSSWIAVARRPA